MGKDSCHFWPQMTGPATACSNHGQNRAHPVWLWCLGAETVLAGAQRCPARLWIDDSHRHAPAGLPCACSVEQAPECLVAHCRAGQGHHIDFQPQCTSQGHNQGGLASAWGQGSATHSSTSSGGSMHWPMMSPVYCCLCGLRQAGRSPVRRVCPECCLPLQCSGSTALVFHSTKSAASKMNLTHRISWLSGCKATCLAVKMQTSTLGCGLVLCPLG